MPEPYYTTADNLRTELGIDEATLGDTAATNIIMDAEDLIDHLLGFWPVDETTGRKIVEDDVETWQWDKLGRATVKLAAKLYSDSSVLEGRTWDSVSGPDFSFSGAIGSEVNSQVTMILDGTGLRRLMGRAVPPSREYSSDVADKFFTTGQPKHSREV